MITTWGIFWISFFGAAILNSLIKRIITPKYPKLDKDTYDKLRELVTIFASNIKVDVKSMRKTKAKKEEETEATH